MSDDIVTRLREYDFMRDGDIPDVIMNKAADEIERLRRELHMAEKWRDNYKFAFEKELGNNGDR